MLDILKVFTKMALRKSGVVFFLSLCFLAGSLTNISIITTKDVATKVVNENLSKFKRPIYDILIRPKGSASSTEKNYSIVEGNFIQETRNKISVDAYKKIKSIKGVKVAAPVAPLGYAPSQLVTCNYFFEYSPKEKVFVHNQTIASDGIRKFVNYSTKELVEPPFYTVFLEGSKKYLQLGALFPISCYFVVGIDPKEEARLGGLKKAIISGKYLIDSTPYYHSSPSNNENARANLIIPALVSNSAYNNSEVKIVKRSYRKKDYESIDKSKLPDTSDMRRGSKLWDLMSAFRPISEATLTIPASENITPFYRNHFVWKDGKLTKIDTSWFYEQPFYPAGIGAIKEGSAKTNNVEINLGAVLINKIILTGQVRYQKTHTVKNWRGIELTAKPIGKRSDKPYFMTEVVYGGLTNYLEKEIIEDAPVYRLTKVKKVPFSYELVPVGKIDLSKVSASQQKLENWVPLGMYIPPKVILVYSQKGQPVNQKEVYPVDDPRMLLINSPLGFVHLKAVEKIRGKNCLSAIRVRCNSEKDIDEVVRKIKKIGDFEINIVYGSSPQKILVGDLAYQGAKGIGFFQQLWTTLGANLSLALTHDRFKKVLLVLNLTVLILLAAAYSIFYHTGSEPENKILDSTKMGTLFSKALYASFILIPLTIALLASLIAASFLAFSSIPGSFWALLVNIILFAFFFLLFSALFTFLRKPASVNSCLKNLSKNLKLKSAVILSIKNELAFPGLILIQTALFGISQALIIITALSIYSIYKDYSLFILGERILKENLANYIFLTASALLIAFITSSASSFVRAKRIARDISFLKTIGWDSKPINTYSRTAEVLIILFGNSAAILTFLAIFSTHSRKPMFTPLLLLFILAAAVPTGIHLIMFSRMNRKIDEIQPLSFVKE